MLRITALASFLALGACGGGGSCPDRPSAQVAPTSTAAPDNGTGQQGPGECPMDHPNVDVSVSDVQDGAMLTMTASPDDVEQVRAMGRHMKQMHAHRMQHPGAGPQRGMGHGMMMLASRVSAEEIENGIRMTFVAENLADVENLRSRVRQHAEMMRTGDCPMMHDEPPATESQPPV